MVWKHQPNGMLLPTGAAPVNNSDPMGNASNGMNAELYEVVVNGPPPPPVFLPHITPAAFTTTGTANAGPSSGFVSLTGRFLEQVWIGRDPINGYSTWKVVQAPPPLATVAAPTPPLSPPNKKRRTQKTSSPGSTNRAVQESTVTAHSTPIPNSSSTCTALLSSAPFRTKDKRVRSGRPCTVATEISTNFETSKSLTQLAMEDLFMYNANVWK